MNGPQDVGGAAGFGPVNPEPNEPVFHAEWERRALALGLASNLMGHWSLDEVRFTRASIPPAEYYASSYYAIWIKALERLLVRHGFVTEAELAAGHALTAGARPPRVLRAAEVADTIARGNPYDRDPEGRAAVFAPGDRVRTVVMHPPGHTQLPRFARGKLGRIEAVQGFHVFPDSNAHRLGEAPQWLYTVVFDATEIWGRDGDPNGTISIDAWESYLERA